MLLEASSPEGCLLLDLVSCSSRVPREHEAASGHWPLKILSAFDWPRNYHARDKNTPRVRSPLLASISKLGTYGTQSSP